jgi:hypothetical protein
MNEHVKPRKEDHMADATTAELLAEAQDLLGKAERSLARLSRRLPSIVKGVIKNGDAQSLGALRQIELQALAHSETGRAYLIIVQLHQALYAASSDAGLEAAAPPAGDDDVVIFSSGR